MKKLNLRDDRGYTIIEVFAVLWLIVGLFSVIGWGKDIYKLIHCDFEAPYKAEICYGVGLIPPVGAIMGWINIED